MPIIAILVVVGVLLLCVVGGLVGLLLPAISAAREAARRSACSNNLRQIGLGLHAYTDVWRSLPPAYTVDASGRPLHSWRVLILPFMDYGGLYDQIRLDEPWDSPHNAKTAEGVVVPQYRCLGVEAYGPDLGKIHYAGIAGMGPDAATRPLTAPGVGMFGYDRNIALADVKDGTANTVMVMETGRDLGPWTRGGPTTVRGLAPSGEPLVGAGGRFGGNHVTDKTIWSRSKSSGTNVLMADASTRTIADSISTISLYCLATIAGGEGLPTDW